MSTDFDRPKEGFEFLPGGLKTNAVPNYIPKDKYALATNVRWTLDGSVRTRPGQTLKFSTGGQIITDIGSYATLGTDDLPRYLVRDTNDAIWLDNGTSPGSLASGNKGAMFLPWRPANSPQSWLYVANGADYQKFSAPIANVITQRKVGIAEPQSAPDACPEFFYYHFADIQPPGQWTPSGTAGAVTAVTRINDTVVRVIQDPASNPLPLTLGTPAPRCSVQVGASQQYQAGMLIMFNTPNQLQTVVQDVITPLSSTSFLISGIQYVSGSTGRATISTKAIFTDQATGNRLAQNLLLILKRGAIITFSGGVAESVIILSATIGPDGSIAIDCSTTSTHAAGEQITFQKTIICDVMANASGAITDGSPTGGIDKAAQSTIAVGTGFLTTSTLIPFATAPFPAYNSSGTQIFSNSWIRPDDYFHVSLNISDLTQLSQVAPAIRILFDVGDGSFTQNYFYFDVAASDLVSAVASTQTQLGAAQISAQKQAVRLGADVLSTQGIRARFALDQSVTDPNVPDLIGVPAGSAGSQTALGASQWTEIIFPVSAMTRVGNDQAKNLFTINKIQLQFIVLANCTVQVHSLWAGGGGLPDVGTNNAPYLYRVRPRDSRTGARGNPSPPTRYGVLPRRQQVAVTCPQATDAQIDTWDVFRFGGTVTSWRYVGSVAASQIATSTFYDNVFDDVATVGEALDFDNHEPWPSIDLPQNLSALQVTGTLWTVTVPAPTNATRWLPGTLLQLLSTRAAYTLRRRPVLLSGTTYLVEVEEPAPFSTNTALSIPEPILGNQKLPYIWGPDVNGYVYACGDPLRPGVVYWSKPYAPDMCPDTNNQEIIQPAEPLLGGEIVDGLSFVGSTEQWWALYPSGSTITPGVTATTFTAVQQGEPRGIAAPYGHCTDGKSIYYWAKDGIRATGVGSLTDADLYNLFPHEGVVGYSGAQQYTYNGVTYPPPDYSRAGNFRLALVNGYLHAVYTDSGGNFNTLTLDTRRGAWCFDQWTPTVTAIFHPRQQAGTIIASTTRYDEMLMGSNTGLVSVETDLVTDAQGFVTTTLATFEFDGGDLRAPCQWGDYFVDLVPAASAIVSGTPGVAITPCSQGSPIAATVVIPTNGARQRIPVSIGGIVVSDFIGLFIQWKDAYSGQSVPTQIHAWQPSFDIQPTRDVAFFTFGTSFDMRGFMHIPELTFAYVSNAPITVVISVVDGTAPATITLPSSGGVYTKKFFRPTFNKGRLYNFAFSVPVGSNFQYFEDDSEMLVGEWGRSDSYKLIRGLGERTRESAPI